MHALKAKKLEKRYGGFLAVDSVSFEVEEGECFGLLGTNGAGKSTLINMVAGLLSPSGGSMVVMGMDSQKQWRDVKMRMGHCFGFSNYMGNMTGRQNLVSVGFAHGMTMREVNRRVDELAELIGLDKVDEDCSHYSSGMIQKLSLMAALLHNPDMLLVDELTVGLDVRSAKQIRKVLKSFKGEKTIILTTHYMEEADELCDRIALMHRGKLVAVKGPEAMKRWARSYDLLELETSDDELARELLVKRFVLEAGLKCHVAGNDVQGIFELLQSNGVKVKRVSLREPTLEEVFERLGDGE